MLRIIVFQSYTTSLCVNGRAEEPIKNTAVEKRVTENQNIKNFIIYFYLYPELFALCISTMSSFLV